jgi:hypothetical protein
VTGIRARWIELRQRGDAPLAAIVALAGIVRAIGIGWGLPSSDGWDNDGVAPRDFLAGLVETFTPGHHYTYPPVHLLLLGLLTLPISLSAVARAKSTAPPDVVAEILRVPYMTAIAYVARLVSWAMSLAIVYAVGRIADEIATAITGDPERGRRAGWCAAATAAVNVPLTYYAHTTNLDVPYLFWACLALLALTRAILRQEPRRLRACALLAVAAIGTKDQAYALFLVGLPAALIGWLASDPWPRRHWREDRARDPGRGRPRPPCCFSSRTPSSSTDRLSRATAFSPRDREPGLRALHERLGGSPLGHRGLVRHFDRYYPVAFAPLASPASPSPSRAHAGARSPRRSSRSPLPCRSRSPSMSRAAHRAPLPPAADGARRCLMSGWRSSRSCSRARRRWRVALQGATSLLFAVAVFDALAVDANLVLDPRYDAERWMRAHVGAGDRIEVHGLNVLLAAFPAHRSRDPRRPRSGLPQKTPCPHRGDRGQVLQHRGPQAALRRDEPRLRVALLPRSADRAVVRRRSRLSADPNREQRRRGRERTSFRRLVQQRTATGFVHGADWHSDLWPRSTSTPAPAATSGSTNARSEPYSGATVRSSACGRLAHTAVRGERGDAATVPGGTTPTPTPWIGADRARFGGISRSMRVAHRLLRCRVCVPSRPCFV